MIMPHAKQIQSNIYTHRKRITVLGATGSIGDHTIELLKQQPESFEVVALTAQRNAARLAERAILLGAQYAVIAEEAAYHELKEHLKGTSTIPMVGAKAVTDVAGLPVDVVVAGITGFSGLRAVMAAIQAGNTVALANKEALVAAGPVVLKALEMSQTALLPVDSEHSAIFQVWDPLQAHAVEKVILTASGGPFRTYTTEQMKNVTPEQAVAHPRWSMGAKISVDSATMMNKGLELIEAHYLFHVGAPQLEVLVHPESIIHSMVQYRDGSVLAQLGLPDMCTPISYALAWPERMQVERPRLDLAAMGALHFEAPDEGRFPCLRLAREALAMGGGTPAVLNAANEAAVDAFLKKQLSFPHIAKVVEEVLDQYRPAPPATVEEVETIDADARALAQECIGS